MNVVMVDNRDSFTFNLVYDLRMLGCDVETWRNDTPVPHLLDRATARRAPIVISPGPGAPREAGNCIELVRAAAGRFALLGICLGHQAIVEAFGGTVGPATDIVHGRATPIRLSMHGLFEGLPGRVALGRYHSLAATSVPDCLETIAQAEDGATMAVVHRKHRIVGYQFHPESILSAGGRRLLAATLRWMGGQDASDA